MKGATRHGRTGPAMFDLHGRTAFVTGARSGIGAAVAVGLAEAGAELILVGRRDDTDETAEAVRKCGRQAETIGLDLSDTAAVRGGCAELLARRRIDIVVNNAGMITRAEALETSDDDWTEVHRVNLDAVWTICQTVGRSMVERGSGKIINVVSLLSFQGGVRVVPYTSSKHAVVGITRALANEWGSSGVQVNAIAPGYIATANTAPLRADPASEASISARIPAGRWGCPDDLAGAAVFLAAPASDYVNGHILVVDGGWLAR
jgi:2-dehydro-3-deoxy-D-gluconate 5-dehydrogenase